MTVDRDIERDPTSALIRRSGARRVVSVIGIDRYRYWPALKNAVNDAEGARALFRGLGFEEVAPPLLDEGATGEALRALVTDELMCLGEHDSLVLFYAGHGGTRTQHLEERRIELGYLIPHDAKNVRDKVATWIDLHGWLRRVSLLPPRHILVILDTCHSGIALDPVFKWRDLRSPQDVPLSSLSERRSRRVITSALGDQVALDQGPLHGHSLFTGCLIEGLRYGIPRNGRPATTGSELGLYVQQRVMAYAHSRQTPDFGAFELDERGELLIPFSAGHEDASPLPTAAPAPSALGGDTPCVAELEHAELRSLLLARLDKATPDRLLFDAFGYDRRTEIGGGSLTDIVDRVLRDFARRGLIPALLLKLSIRRY